MKKLLALIMLAFALGAALARADEKLSFKANGRDYTNVELKSRDPVSITVFTDTGIERIRFDALPTELQTKFQYAPAAAAAWESQESERLKAVKVNNARAAEEKKRQQQGPQQQFLAEINQQIKDADAVGKKITEQRAKEREAGIFFIYGKVLQKLKTGVLVNAKGGSDFSSSVVFLQGYPSEADLVDGDSITANANLDGQHQYTSTTGAIASVRKFKFVGAPSNP